MQERKLGGKQADQRLQVAQVVVCGLQFAQGARPSGGSDPGDRCPFISSPPALLLKRGLLAQARLHWEN